VNDIVELELVRIVFVENMQLMMGNTRNFAFAKVYEMYSGG
jgi:hypothetical protein